MYREIEKARPYKLLSPVVMLACALALGVYLRETGASLAVNCAMAALTGAAAAVTYLRDTRAGMLSAAVIYVVYVALGAAAGLSGWRDWLFFLVWSPVLCLCMAGMRRRLEKLRLERDYQTNVNERESLIHAGSELRNLRAFQNDAMIYIRIAKRYHLCLGLILWRLENAAALKSGLGEEEFMAFMRKVSRVMRSSLRFEDMTFLLDDTPQGWTWGTLHIANSESVNEMVAQRLMPKLAAMHAPNGMTVRLTTHTVLADNARDLSPMTLLDEANKA